MFINKHKQSTVKTDYFFVKGKLPSLNTEYFINEIHKGITKGDNENHKTNVKGYMTSYKYFIKDDEFIKLILPMMDYVEKYDLYKNKFQLHEAWGLRESFIDYTTLHDHGSSAWSGVIYLSNINQNLIFPEIEEEVSPEIGNFAIFSSFLKHKTEKRIDTKEIKYGLSFNFIKTDIY